MSAYRRYPQAFTLVAAVVLWQVTAVALHPVWLPTANAVGAAWWDLVRSGAFGELGSTVRTLAIGLAVVFVAGAAVSLLIAASGVVREALHPLLNAALAIPTTAIIPAFILVWGLSDLTRVATVVSFALVPLIVQWSAAAAPVDLLEMARSFDAPPLRRLVSVALPSAAPVILTGVRIATVQGIKGVVSAEILIGVIGIGKLMQTAIVTFDLARLYAVIITLAAITFALYLVLERLERRAARRTALDIATS